MLLKKVEYSVCQSEHPGDRHFGLVVGSREYGVAGNFGVGSGGCEGGRANSKDFGFCGELNRLEKT